MNKLYILLLSVIILGCANSRIPREYIETQLQRFEEIGTRERNLQMPISGSIEIDLLEHYLLNRDDENLTNQLPLLITADFTFRTAREFSVSFTEGLDGHPYTANVSDSAVTVIKNDGNIVDIPVNLLWCAADEYVAYEMTYEMNQYLWGIKCILTHLFPLTNGWKVHQDILNEKNQSDYILVSSDEESGIELLTMGFEFNNLKRRYVTQMVDVNPALFLIGEHGVEKLKAISYLDYVIWDSEKNWFFPTTVGDFGNKSKHTSTLISVSSPKLDE